MFSVRNVQKTVSVAYLEAKMFCKMLKMNKNIYLYIFQHRGQFTRPIRLTPALSQYFTCHKTPFNVFLTD